MSAAGELIPHAGLRGEVLPAAPSADTGGRGGTVFDDVISRLRGYVAPPPPGELAWQATAGAGLTLAAAGLLALLPSGDAVAGSGFLRWVGRSGLAGTTDSAAGFVGPLALLAVFVLSGIGLIYASGWGEAPALFFLSAQTWIGVLSLVGAVVAWLYFLFIVVVNLVFWIGLIVLGIIGLIAVLALLGLFLSS